ncbi:MAG: aminoacetone oxidase family FAD-binding enzyme, partial [Ketobacteraceae bacterium]|nr:aminoacetone oxidase family FAD-binding enzyme [Ketobacteraceae bacterium]
MSQSKSYDVVVVGGGAAGLFCAALAAARGRSVMVLERTGKVGKKILMSGGGRCNFTNMEVTPENFLSANPHFCKSALSRYTQWDFIGLVCDYGIPYHEKKLGQLFCDNSAKDILNLLLAECDKAGARIQCRCDIRAITHDGRFRLETDRGIYQAEAVVIASGGLSIPTMGVTGFGYEVARQFGMSVLPTSAALVPFTLGEPWLGVANRLSGLSVEVVASNPKAAFRENLLMTHRGLSGPAMLQLSSYWKPGEAISVDLLPGISAGEQLLEYKARQPRGLLRTWLNRFLPKNLVSELEAQWWPELAERPISDWKNDALMNIGEQLNGWVLVPSGTEGYRTAEVTLGG